MINLGLVTLLQHPDQLEALKQVNARIGSHRAACWART
jgi:hypothetical protein